MKTRAPDTTAVERGQRIYTPLVLRAYDVVELEIVGAVALFTATG